MKLTPQCQRVLNALMEHAPSEVSLSRLMDLRVASLTRRISDLRVAGYVIENRREKQPDGTVHSWYALLRWENPEARAKRIMEMAGHEMGLNGVFSGKLQQAHTAISAEEIASILEER